MSRFNREDWEEEENKRIDERNRRLMQEYKESRKTPIEDRPFDPDGPPLFEINGTFSFFR